MKTLNDILDNAVADSAVPFAVAMTGNSDGITFSGASGNAAEGRAAAEDTVFRAFSMTKAVGSIAAMMLIDQGKLSADTPVAEILPEWNELQVLDGFDGDKARIRRWQRFCRNGTSCRFLTVLTETSLFYALRKQWLQPGIWPPIPVD